MRTSTFLIPRMYINSPAVAVRSAESSHDALRLAQLAELAVTVTHADGIIWI